jgi:NADPH:quinone reductase-like Zn-dependent oxidoreductase
MHEIGASETIDFTEGPTPDQVGAAHPGGIDAVVDLISEPGQIEPIAALLKPNGVLVSSNGAADSEVLATRGLRGANLYANARPATLASLADAVAHGQLRIRIDHQVPLADAAGALARSKEGRARGKTVLVIS